VCEPLTLTNSPVPPTSFWFVLLSCSSYWFKRWGYRLINLSIVYWDNHKLCLSSLGRWQTALWSTIISVKLGIIWNTISSTRQISRRRVAPWSLSYSCYKFSWRVSSPKWRMKKLSTCCKENRTYGSDLMEYKEISRCHCEKEFTLRRRGCP